ncbi:MAG: hypothetical protein H6822_13455 [Planctomycetaceae bacterium]|nr:hypothetical protein [Planctomycetales bacterium]MCB9923183.1 hypothetical protein [Planctomycetaceae bacterium]
MFRDSVIEQLGKAAMEHLDRQELERQAIESCLGALQEDQRRLVLSIYSPGESIARLATEAGENRIGRFATTAV